MAEAFLASLPKVDLGMLAKEDQRCPISIEDYGTIPSISGTSTIELAVRLPCSHVIGSKFISIWLTTTHGQRSNNTCPICRHVLYQVEQPQIVISQPIIEHTQIYLELNRCIAVIARRLDLNDNAAQLAAHIFLVVHEQGRMGDHCVAALAAAILYMASHATGDPRSLHAISRKLAIARLGDVGPDSPLSRAYNMLYQSRRVLLHEPLLRRITPWTLESVDAALPLPQF